jgi:YD repeat-containing protein
MAQEGLQTPPRQDSQSPAGVSYRSGSFSHQEADLGAGDENASGIVFSRNYDSTIDSTFSQGLLTQGWSHNFSARVSENKLPSYYAPPVMGQARWIYQVSLGSKSYGFQAGVGGGFAGKTYTPVVPNGTSLTFTGTEQAGNHTFTDADGTVAVFGSRQLGLWVQNITSPDGTRLDFIYDSTNDLRAVYSNRGFAILFETNGIDRRWQKICIVNLAYTHVSGVSTCPSGAPSATYVHTGLLLTAVTKPDGETTEYSYVGSNHLGCIKLPGNSVCSVSNVYNVCHRDPELTQDPPGLRLMDKVIQQTLASGEVINYSFPIDPECPDESAISLQTRTMTRGDGTTVNVTTGMSGMPRSVTDGLNRTTTINYVANPSLFNETVLVSRVTNPEGDYVDFSYDSRGNLTERRAKPKPGSTLLDIVSSATYPASCIDSKICNKPTSVTDGLSNTTIYTYDASHGGVLTKTLPAVGGIHPQVRYSYAQRYTWMKTLSGGYAQAATPIWVLTEERTCRTTATVGGACSGGVSDEVVTAYEYQAGNATTPSNLLLKGTTVTADGQTLRTCYGHDERGRKISETKPAAGLTVCP